jgi:hypothetical protein
MPDVRCPDCGRFFNGRIRCAFCGAENPALKAPLSASTVPKGNPARKSDFKVLALSLGFIAAAFVGVAILIVVLAPPPAHQAENVPTSSNIPTETVSKLLIKVATTNCGADAYATLIAMRLSYGSYDPKYHVMLDDCQTIWVDASDITTADPELACMFTSDVASE